MALPQLVVGALLLTLGKRLFWLFVAGAGFLAGLQFAPRLLPGQPTNVILIAALVVAVAGAVLAVLLQRLAVGLAGFVVGGYAAVYLAESLGLLGNVPANPPGLPTAALASLASAIPGGPPIWLIFLVGGVIGALLVAAVFDLALVVLSSLAGAALVVPALGLPAGLELVFFVVLVALGILIQTRLFKGRS